MIREYENQTATLKTLSSTDEHGKPTYSTSTITCRLEYSRKNVINREGREVISEIALFTRTAVSTDDAITHDSKDWPVLAVKKQPGLDGVIKFYEVRL